eukprot:m.138706 g.138706  ORF g.138706 m.138706 type:complete len:243 (-) comp17036_c0_seq9:895-1623(-)
MASYESDHNLLPFARQAAAAAARLRQQSEEGDGSPAANLMQALEGLGLDGLFSGDGVGPGSGSRGTNKQWLAELDLFHPTDEEIEEKLACPVCMLEFVAADKVHALPCDHIFHPDCIVPWMQKVSTAGSLLPPGLLSHHFATEPLSASVIVQCRPASLRSFWLTCDTLASPVWSFVFVISHKNSSQNIHHMSPPNVWQRNTCPMCRYEVPSDDPAYEEHKRHEARAKEREAELEMLHDSMYG